MVSATQKAEHNARTVGRPAAAQPQPGRLTVMATKSATQNEAEAMPDINEAANNLPVNSDGFPVERVTGSPRGRRPGSQPRVRVLTRDKVQVASRETLGLSVADMQDMFTKQVGPVGRQANERTETELFVRDEVIATWNRYADADYPADSPGNRIGSFVVIESVSWDTRESMKPLDAQTLKRLAAIPSKEARKAALSQIPREYYEETFSPEIEDARKDLNTALRDLRKPDEQGEVLPIGMHIYAPRQHVSGAHVIPFTVYLRSSAQDRAESDAEASEEATE